MITLEKVEVRVQATQAKVLEVANLTLADQQVIGLFGRSGSGKTTLLDAVAGQLDSATLIQTGKITTPFARLGEQWRYIPQDAANAFDPIERMQRQFEATFSVYGYPRAQWPAMIAQLCERMAIPMRVLRQYPGQLSGGLLQRCLVGLGLVGQPRLILADEPTSALDAVGKQVILDAFSHQAASGSTIIIATHDWATLTQLCQAVVVVTEGQVSAPIPIEAIEASTDPYLSQVIAAHRLLMQGGRS